MQDDPRADGETAAALPAAWRELALSPPRAHGGPCGEGLLRATPEDFIVEEQLAFAPAGTGPHALLRVRKRGANTDWVARGLAREAGVRPMDVGYAGLKDRHAVTTQWFTVPLPHGREAGSWVGIAGEDWQVLEAHAHQRKLPRGALDANRFELRLRQWRGERAALEARLAAIARDGVPNYFGPQRFGRGLSNLRAGLRAHAGGGRADEYALSAARSLIFNAVLARRVADGSWTQLAPGELANLDGSNSTFAVRGDEPDLTARLAQLDIHPTGPLWGSTAERGMTGPAAALEAETAERFAPLLAVLQRARMAPARRALRLAVRELAWEFEAEDTVRICFLLRAGGYATAVLRELTPLAEEALSADPASPPG